MTILIVGITGLLILVAVFLLAIFSAHIPGLRHLTGAERLEPASRKVPYTEAATETDSSFLLGDFPPKPLDHLPAQRNGEHR